MKVTRAGPEPPPPLLPTARGGTQEQLSILLCPHWPPPRQRSGGPPSTHPLVDVLPAGLILLLHALLQEVDAQLEAEVLLLQVIEVLGQSAISIRHGGQPMGRSTCPAAPLSPGTWCSCTAA